MMRIVKYYEVKKINETAVIPKYISLNRLEYFNNS